VAVWDTGGARRSFPSRRSSDLPEPGVRHNFWLIEAIACYFESLAPREGYLTVGGTETQRFRAAQYRLLNDRFYVPLAELCGLGRDRKSTRLNSSHVKSSYAVFC